MFDAFHLPNKYLHNVQIFNPTTGVVNQGLQAWHKPRGTSMTMMIAVAGGGGGGGGAAGAAGTARIGGGGGACSGVARFICPNFVLPDVCYVSVGCGGIGGLSAANGTAGTNSFVYSNPGFNVALPNIILASGVNAPGGGQTAGTGGSVPSVAVTQPIHTLGNWAAITGIIGGAGVAGAAGTTVTAWAAIPFSPGAGGGANSVAPTEFAGGGQTATAIFDYGSQGYHVAGASALLAGGVVTGGNGNAGRNSITPFFNCGGSGGGAGNSVAGGVGGAGGIGSGGGGGGAGVTGSGGMGGNGGPGVVIIISW